MFIALNKNKERVPISNIDSNENYYCPICGENLVVRRGTINAHHFAHKTNSICTSKDGWHYDMSQWHYDWQNQFPIKNQEVVFTDKNKTHRADIFINNTVIEFQHSPISEAEFNDRNNFYKNLGYKVIWIFDAEGKNIEYLHDSKMDKRVMSWKSPIRFLKKLDCNDPLLDVYLQTKEGIWYRQPNYKEVKDYNQLEIEANIIKISDNHFDGLNTFISDEFYSDIEIINDYYDLHLQNKKRYSYKKLPNIHKLTDEIYNYNIENFYSFYGYCPYLKTEFYNHKECHACNYLDYNCMRCKYRFKNLKEGEISEIYDVKYDRDGRVIYIDIEINNQRKQYELNPLPSYTKSLLDFSKVLKNIRVARFINIESGKKIQLSWYGMQKLISTRKCFGKLCSPLYRKASTNEFEIFNWDKPIWLLVWYKFED